jgi:hypothetical protein
MFAEWDCIFRKVRADGAVGRDMATLKPLNRLGGVVMRSYKTPFVNVLAILVSLARSSARPRLIVESSGSDFTETVEGNHFFFIGAVGARVTVENILRLYAFQSIPSTAATSPK